MKQLTCEMCGSTDLIKNEGVFVCQSCGCKYSLEEAKRMMTEGIVEVQGAVAVNKNAELENYLQMAGNAEKTMKWRYMDIFADKALLIDPEHPLAWFYKGTATAGLLASAPLTDYISHMSEAQSAFARSLDYLEGRCNKGFGISFDEALLPVRVMGGAMDIPERATKRILEFYSQVSYGSHEVSLDALESILTAFKLVIGRVMNILNGHREMIRTVIERSTSELPNGYEIIDASMREVLDGKKDWDNTVPIAKVYSKCIKLIVVSMKKEITADDIELLNLSDSFLGIFRRESTCVMNEKMLHAHFLSMIGKVATNDSYNLTIRSAALSSFNTLQDAFKRSECLSRCEDIARKPELKRFYETQSEVRKVQDDKAVLTNYKALLALIYSSQASLNAWLPEVKKRYERLSALMLEDSTEKLNVYKCNARKALADAYRLSITSPLDYSSINENLIYVEAKNKSEWCEGRLKEIQNLIWNLNVEYGKCSIFQRSKKRELNERIEKLRTEEKTAIAAARESTSNAQSILNRLKSEIKAEVDTRVNASVQAWMDTHTSDIKFENLSVEVKLTSLNVRQTDELTETLKDKLGYSAFEASYLLQHIPTTLTTSASWTYAFYIKRILEYCGAQVEFDDVSQNIFNNCKVILHFKLYDTKDIFDIEDKGYFVNSALCELDGISKDEAKRILETAKKSGTITPIPGRYTIAQAAAFVNECSDSYYPESVCIVL